MLTTGPVRSIVEIEYQGWKIGGRAVNLISRFTQWAGEHGFEHRIAVSDSQGVALAAALPREAQAEQDQSLGRDWGPGRRDLGP